MGCNLWPTSHIRRSVWGYGVLRFGCWGKVSNEGEYVECILVWLVVIRVVRYRVVRTMMHLLQQRVFPIAVQIGSQWNLLCKIIYLLHKKNIIQLLYLYIIHGIRSRELEWDNRWLDRLIIFSYNCGSATNEFHYLHICTILWYLCMLLKYLCTNSKG